MLAIGLAGVAAGAGPDAVRVRRDCSAGSAIRWSIASSAAAASRNTAVVLVFCAMAALVLLALLLLVPMIERQLVTLFESLPRYRDWFVGTALPWLERKTGLELVGVAGSATRSSQLIRAHWEQAGGAAATMLGYLSRRGSRCSAGSPTSCCCRC